MYLLRNRVHSLKTYQDEKEERSGIEETTLRTARQNDHVLPFSHDPHTTSVEHHATWTSLRRNLYEFAGNDTHRVILHRALLFLYFLAKARREVLTRGAANEKSHFHVVPINIAKTFYLSATFACFIG